MSRFGWGGSNVPARKAARKVQLQLEALEDRLVPAATTTYTVAAGDVATLIADINAANANGASTPTTINLTAGTYMFTAADNNTYGPNALPAITGDVTINGNGAVLERDPSLGQNTPFRFFYVSGANVASPSGTQSTGAATGSLTLENLTLEGGLSEGGSSDTGGGGLGAGGAIFNQGSLTLNGVTVEQSAAIGGSGGTGTSTNGGSLGTTNTAAGTFGVGGNDSTSGSGGAGGFGAGGGSGSTGGAGGFGAGASDGSTGGGGLGAGGAIFNMYGTTTLINSTIADNLVQGGTGANNGSGYGGAVFNVDGTISITTSTIADNQSTAGGAVYNLAMGTTTDSTGAAQGITSTVNLTDSILADSIGGNDLVNDQNTSTAGSAVVNATTPNIVMASSTIDGATTNGTPNTANPNLGLLYNYGGPTPTMPLLAGSAALGAGVAGTNVPSIDQRGATRGAVLDLGAYQATPPETAATTTTLTSSSSTTSTGQSVTLTATVTATSGTTTPTGTVQFVDTTTGTVLGTATVTVNNGQAQATLTTTALTPTSHSITATYTSSNGLGSSSGSTTVNAGSTNQQWLNQVYEDLLGRPIDASGLSYWSAALSNASPTQVVYDIEQTTEYRTNQIQAAYQNLLGVSAPSSAVNYLLGLMQSGADFRTVQAVIAGSNAFYQANGGTIQGFLSAVYQDFLNRPLDATGQAQWGALLAAGYNPTQVVLGILNTPEYLTNLVKADYQTYLGRAADTNSLNAYVSALEGGNMNNEMVIASLIASTFQSV
ncbi:MAG TPA: DUF4214 domain-containing protein [Gemmataceae bacterium]|nr:DUF4214 domain-containing protein [Gemmataceae bacterium]